MSYWLGQDADREVRPPVAGSRARCAVRLWAQALAWGLACSPPLYAQGQPGTPSIADLKKLSVEQLSDVEVSSVSRREETLGDAPAAVAVLTNEDIRRSGATTV